ncbi:MAG: hypothetical protein ACREPV_10585 [Lysobacter sp.]
MLALALSAAPLAHADECMLQLGHGWPPATENHGSAVEQLLIGDAGPVLSLTWLPKRGTEQTLMLLRPADGGDWTLRHAEPPERIDSQDTSGGGFKRILRVDQQPELREVPMPATLAARVLDSWQRALQAGVPADRVASFHDDELLLFVIEGERISGLEPGCGAGEVLMEQAEQLIEAADEEDAEDRIDHWQDMDRSLNELYEALAAGG